MVGELIRLESVVSIFGDAVLIGLNDPQQESPAIVAQREEAFHQLAAEPAVVQRRVDIPVAQNRGQAGTLEDERRLGIRASRLPPRVLSFELTETATVGNLQSAQQFIQRLQDLGCGFALDDFGTGVSSLAYLKELSVNHVKIDGRFVRDIIENPRSESMIKAIAQLARNMGMRTIAEYVETDALRARVAELGCDYGQGFAMGRTLRLEGLLIDLASYEANVAPAAPTGLFRYREAS